MLLGLWGFNPRTRVGCDQENKKVSKVGMFQSTHPCGVRRRVAICCATSTKFQSTHPCGVRRFYKVKKSCRSLFQSTHPCGVRQKHLPNMSPKSAFQSTHPCGVRPWDKQGQAVDHVSIHAPVWGATSDWIPVSDLPKVSIHAPVWGATGEMFDDIAELSFNPRTRVGCDGLISRVFSAFKRFNPRTRVGCDIKGGGK